MAYTQEDLDLVEKHVAQGERNVLQQRQIVAGLSQNGYPTADALNLLASLENTVQQLRQRRSMIRGAVYHTRSQRVPVAMHAARTPSARS